MHPLREVNVKPYPEKISGMACIALLCGFGRNFLGGLGWIGSREPRRQPASGYDKTGLFKKLKWF